MWKIRFGFGARTRIQCILKNKVTRARHDHALSKCYLPAPLFAFGLVIGKCETNPYSETFSGTRIPACAPKCSQGDLDSLKTSNPQRFQSGSSGNTACNGGSTSAQSNVKPVELTHTFLLKQASSIIVDSVTRLLTETVSALDDYHQQYREMMGMLLALLEEGRVASPVHLELLNCKMIVLRSQMEDVRLNLNEIEMFLSSVEALTNQAAQTAYLARAEYPSIALSERLQSAMLQVNRIKCETKELENDLLQLQAVVIVESGKSLK